MSELANLLSDTEKVLRQLAALPLLQEFTFVGGSALAVHLGHRLSEDIDLFTWHKQLNIADLQNTLTNTFGQVRIVNLSPAQADFIVEGVKTTFFANGWETLQQRTQLLDNLYIANLATLAVMKVNTLFMRAKYRDYYDLYTLNKVQFSLQELFELTNAQMKNLSKTLFQRALVFTEDITNEHIAHLQPKENVSLNEISKHFQQQIKIWNKLKP